MMPRALVVGGTGPTGPFLVQGMLDRGYEVAIFHRGTHELDELPPVEHIHGDPHFLETIGDALGDREFDVVLAMYGRVRLLAEYLHGRCGQFMIISGAPVYAGYNDPETVRPYGLPVPTSEDSPLVDVLAESNSLALQFGRLMVETHRTVLELHPSATCFRYPVVYGPRNPSPWEWSVVKRILDGRSRIIVPDGGMSIYTRCASRNAAEFVLRAVDRPDVAAGRTYNCGDDEQYTIRQWVELIAVLMESPLEVIGIPSAVAVEAQATMAPMVGALSPHALFDTRLAKAELGYADVVKPAEALRQSIAWHLARDPDEFFSNPVMQDRFDYPMEDRLIGAYERAVTELLREVPQATPAALHGMPHPKKPSQVDHRGR